MSISKRSRRKIRYNDQNFLWWVDDIFDGQGGMLAINIASEDKKFIIRHFAIQTKGEPYILVIGERFPGLKKKTGNSMQINCPDFRNSFVDNAVTPKTVSDILDWCFVTNVNKITQVNSPL